MQADIKQLDQVTKEISITVDAETASKDYQKFLRTSAKDVQIPGFRKGKAPLSMVERMHGDIIKSYFIQDATDDYFNQVMREHKLSYLVMPHVKEGNWEPGAELKIVIEIEHEPVFDLVIPEPFEVPFQDQTLEYKVEHELSNLIYENSYELDVETVETGDLVRCEVEFEHNGTSYKKELTYRADEDSSKSFQMMELVGKSVGDTIQVQIKGSDLSQRVMSVITELDNEATYSCYLLVNSILRYIVPELNDEFAKDLDYDSLDALRAELTENLRLPHQHEIYERQNTAILHALYGHNQFKFPTRTLEHIVADEVKNYAQDDGRQYKEFEFRMAFMEYMMKTYLLRAAKNLLEPQLEENDLEDYMTHLAIIEDIPLDAWKEQYYERLNTPKLREEALDWKMLRQIAAKAVFIAPPPKEEIEDEPEEYPEYGEAETAETDNDIKQIAEETPEES